MVVKHVLKFKYGWCNVPLTVICFAHTVKQLIEALDSISTSDLYPWFVFVLETRLLYETQLLLKYCYY